jgi:FkbM family methyltransferase
VREQTTIRTILRRVVQAVGYDVHRRGAMGRTMSMTFEQVRQLGFYPETVIDVGVAEGTPQLYRAFPKAHYLLIEPLAEFQAALGRIGQRLRAESVIAAAGAAKGSMTIRIAGDPAGSSLLREVDKSDATAPSRVVPVVTIDDLCQEHRFEGPFLIKVDVQGGELEALKGAMRTLERTELIIVEISLFGFFVGGPQLIDVVDWMKAAGFVAYDVCGGHCRPRDGALAQVDMAFVKEDGPFRRYQGYR